MALLAGGCATLPPQELDGLPQSPRALVESPFHPQEIHQCGPAALAMVLNRSGDDATPEQLGSEVYLPGREGSLQIELAAATRRHGRIPYRIKPRLADLLQEIEAGNPVLVLQNLGLSWAPRWHYAVAVGYDLERREITLHSGTTPHHTLPLATFLHSWNRGNRWGVVVARPDRLPATAEERSWLQAVAELEKGGRLEAARQGYAAAAERWPSNLGAWMGLGNTEYALGQAEAAEATFRQTADRFPGAPEPLNNLAWLLMERGELEAAEPLARRAVELGGSHIDAARDTLGEIIVRRDAKGLR